MSNAQWGHKESHPNRHGRKEGKGTPAPGKNARGKKAKYSRTGSSRSQPLPKRAQQAEAELSAPPKAIPHQRTVAQRNKDQIVERRKGRPGIRGNEMKSVSEHLHGNPTRHFIGHR